MQPDNIRPAARTANIVLSDMGLLPVEGRARAQCFLYRNCDDSAQALWSKPAAMPAFRWPMCAAARWLWQFCRRAAATKKSAENRRFFKSCRAQKGSLHVGAATAALKGHLRIVGRVAVLGIEHDDDRADLDPGVEVDDVLIGHADAARGNRRADIFRLVGAVDAEHGVAAALEEIERARAERIVDAAWHRCRQTFDALVNVLG